MIVHDTLDVFKQHRHLLHLVDKNSFVGLVQEGYRVAFGEASDIHIFHGKLHRFREKMAEQCTFS